MILELICLKESLQFFCKFLWLLMQRDRLFVRKAVTFLNKRILQFPMVRSREDLV